jgi:hypothetical protein
MDPCYNRIANFQSKEDNMATLTYSVKDLGEITRYTKIAFGKVITGAKLDPKDTLNFDSFAPIHTCMGETKEVQVIEATSVLLGMKIWVAPGLEFPDQFLYRLRMKWDILEPIPYFEGGLTNAHFARTDPDWLLEPEFVELSRHGHICQWEGKEQNFLQLYIPSMHKYVLVLPQSLSEAEQYVLRFS